MDPPRNRKQHRAAASASAAEDPGSFDPSSIPLARPPPADAARNQKKAKTLYEIAAERQWELDLLHGKRGQGKVEGEDVPAGQTPAKTQFVRISPEGEVVPVKAPSEFSSSSSKNGNKVGNSFSNSGTGGNDTEEEADLPPLIDTILLSIPLSALHLTLSYLAAHQYAQEIPTGTLVRESLLIALPVLTFLIHLAHGHIISFPTSKKPPHSSTPPSSQALLSPLSIYRLLFPPTWRTLIFLPLAVVLGGKLVALTNEAAYYAVMKRAPAIGTLWVWCILELSVGAAVVGVVGPIGWGVWWRGYGII